MTANLVSPRVRAGTPRRVLIERRLRRYAPSAQERVRALAARHTRVADLAVSFPALLFALALPRPGENPELAIACAIRGRPLREVAAAARVPSWLRRLPVEGLTRPLPRLPAGEPFGRRIVNHFPRSPKLMDMWLEIVSGADYWINEPFALWIAREFARDAKGVKIDSLRLVGLWAWFSQRAETDAHRFIETRWLAEMRFGVAHGAARAWLNRLKLELAFAGRAIADVWLRPGSFEGYDFVPLDSAERLDEEAAAMGNCIRSYAYDVADDFCRLWSIRRDGRRVANLEVRRGQPLLQISELKAARNEPAPVEIWWLATRWLHQHDLPSIRPAQRANRNSQPDAVVWRRLWRPYWLAKRSLPVWLPLAPTWHVIAALR